MGIQKHKADAAIGYARGGFRVAVQKGFDNFYGSRSSPSFSRSIKGGLAGLVLAAFSMGSCQCDDGDLLARKYCQDVLSMDEEDRPLDGPDSFDNDCDDNVDEDVDRDRDGFCSRSDFYDCREDSINPETNQPYVDEDVENCYNNDPRPTFEYDRPIAVEDYVDNLEYLRAFCPETFANCTDESCTISALRWDCDDMNPHINPAQDEICDQYDNNCDGQLNETFEQQGFQCGAYADTPIGEIMPPCQPSFMDCLENWDGTFSERCNDAERVPGDEICDGIDNDCDGAIDNLPLDESVQTCFGETLYDEAGKIVGYLTASSDEDIAKMINNQGPCRVGVKSCTDECDESLYYVEDSDMPQCVVGEFGGDQICTGVVPRPYEVCNGIDDDCNNIIDDGFDIDQDGFYHNDFGSEECPRAEGCSTDPEEIASGIIACYDCDDTDNTIYPGAPEICDDGIDQDCDGQDQEWVDEDGDGYTSVAVCTDEWDCNDVLPEGEFIYPGAEEICNCQDDNCDGDIDEGFVLEDRLIEVTVDVDCSGSMNSQINPVIQSFSATNLPACYITGDTIRMNTMYEAESGTGKPTLVRHQATPADFETYFPMDIPTLCSGSEPSADGMIYTACAALWADGDTHPHCETYQMEIELFLTDFSTGEQRQIYTKDSEKHHIFLGDEPLQSQHFFTQFDVAEVMNQAGITAHLYVSPLYSDTISDNNYGAIVEMPYQMCTGGEIVDLYAATIIDQNTGETSLTLETRNLLIERHCDEGYECGGE